VDTPPTIAGDEFWAHVAAFGALWGSVEITLGSFLHTLRFPFAGVLLASLSALLLVAARQLLPRRGVTLATGLVAALCKSISPGGVILGPMLGISVEAALVELALLIAPRSRVSAAAAGVLAALWATLQSLIGQVITYGGNIIDLYLAALTRARNWLHLPISAGWWALVGLLGVILLLGGSAGLLGRRLGEESQRRLGREGEVVLDR